MANWGGQTVMFYKTDGADEDVFKAFCRKMTNYKKDCEKNAANNNGVWYIRRLFDYFGHSDEHYPCGRTFVEDVDVREKDGQVRLRVTFAWSPEPEHVWEAFLDLGEFQEAVDFEYIAEECGNGIYINTDTDGRFFPERYCLEYNFEDGNDDTLYPTSEEDLFITLTEIAKPYGISFEGIPRELEWYLDVISAEVSKARDSDIDEYDIYIEIHEYATSGE